MRLNLTIKPPFPRKDGEILRKINPDKRSVLEWCKTKKCCLVITDRITFHCMSIVSFSTDVFILEKTDHIWKYFHL